MTRIFEFLLVTFMLEIQLCFCVRTFDIRWTWANCTAYDATYIKHFTCTMVELPKNRGNYLTSELQFQRDVSNLMIEFALRAPRVGAPSGDMEFFRVRTSACNLAAYKSKSTIVRAMIKKVLQSGNFPKACPLKGNVTYYVKNLTLNPDNFPPQTPDMEFTTNINLLTIRQRDIIASVHIGVRLAKKQ